ncbi:MAG: ATP-binding protein [Clostridia bacterium]|nr:ATP-binding protein [Clostridia bacterium]
MMEFYGCTKELNELRDAINRHEHHCFMVTGNRGTGKTALIAQLLKSAKADILYFPVP